MKKVLLSALSVLMLTVGLYAQDDAKKMMRKATKLLGSYNLDQAANKDKLVQARDLIDKVVEDAEYGKLSKAWLTKGKIYNELANTDTKMAALNPDFVPEGNAAFAAYESFNKGFSLAEKGFEKKDALKGMQETSGYLNNLGLLLYQKGKFKGAFDNFKSVLSIHDMLQSNDEKSGLDNEDDYLNQIYIAAISAMNSDMKAEAAPMFQKLYDKKFENAAVYDALYKLTLDSDEAKALTYLEEGRKAFPDDTSILFSEINHYLKQGKMAELVGKLNVAIEKEPENVSLYTTLGNVHDHLYQNALEAKDEAAAQSQFDSAFKAYNMALGKKEDHFDAVYSLGTLYYNKAASLTKDLNALADDYSKDGTKKYDAKKAEMLDMFGKALPYFEKAEKIKEDDKNTLIALREIFARQDNFEKSNAYKARIEAMGN